jgi:transcriptional regulator of arginine metabolism
MAVRIIERGLSAMLHIYATQCILMRVTDLKERRQRTIADLIRGNVLSSQDELAERLGALGYAVTQATISRDLEQLGAVKTRRGGQLSYALPDQVGEASGPRLAAVLRDWVRSIEAVGNLVVIKTPPGSAHLVGVALDQSDIAEIAGTICGDDTLFLACRGASGAKAVAGKLESGTLDLQ